jgi:hypothetical protein
MPLSPAWDDLPNTRCGASSLRDPIKTGCGLPRLNVIGANQQGTQTMAPDDIPVEHPASETQRKLTGQLDIARRSIGPESEVRGGPETPDSAVDASRRQPVGENRENNLKRTAARDPARKDHKHKVAGGADPPKPPGVPPEVPEPDKPTPIEEPARPIPVPPNDPPPPIVAASPRAPVRSSP